jgi:CheY-like chemotaxis protein
MKKSFGCDVGSRGMDFRLLEISVANPLQVPVLVAEDCEDNRFLLDAYCRGTEYQLMFVEDGEQAVSAYQSRVYEIVVMDIQMPVLDGLSATRLIRTFELDNARKRTPVLALTANVMPYDVVLSLQAGCDLHLPKPISRNTFLGALEQWKPLPKTQAQPPARGFPMS